MGKKLVFLTTCHSTNEEAYDRIGKEAIPDGTVIITDDQTRGRGQMGNTWESAPGENLTFSLILRPSFLAVNEQFRLTMAISLAMLDVLKSFSSGFSVKWPNDIYHLDRKVSGMLIQNTLKGRQLDYSIIGIGLNLNQQNFSYPAATSLSRITGKEYNLQDIFESLLSQIEGRYLILKNDHERRQKKEYLQNMYQFGEDHLYKSGEVFSGRIIDVRPSGELVMETPRGERDFRFKEVEFL
ncbi:biotin--[acetyl-CoA-carboxylase] ligase [Fulvivirga sedimenti]|uniref:Biotin--[acetyl-CoA-carboxylase] ligase n=1 Tax=Fulvivirga sedimenti TaxID=2879465 RepID=A0A9X1L190_9BACT|nr:biotin--[acetyl-CoA-carboxylase] ligase [Fulvivirga sedimenti]MCA6077972.1 biotin--[acetyl-CoA-carboxylase] ligase [Fulvivirga sedimenti]